MFTKSDLYFIGALIVTILIPIKMDRASYIKIQQPVSVAIHKNYPPYQAHVEVSRSQSEERDSFKSLRTIELSLNDFVENKPLVAKIDYNSARLVLEEIKLNKSDLTSSYLQEEHFSDSDSDSVISSKLLVSAKTEPRFARNQMSYNNENYDNSYSDDSRNVISDNNGEKSDDDSWKKELPYRQRVRLELAEKRSDIFSPEAKAAFSKNGIIKPQEKDPSAVYGRHLAREVEREIDPSEPAYGSGLYNGNSNTENKYGRAISRNESEDFKSEESTSNSKSKYKNIIGPIELSEGLAITHEHSIVIRHYLEGVYQERGTINLKEGTYAITIKDIEGLVAAQLLDKNGQVIGEAQARLEILNSNNQNQQGPKLTLSKRKYISGRVYSYYSQNTKNPIQNFESKMFLGNEKVSQSKDHRIEDQRLGYGSQTVLSVNSKNFYPTQKMVISGQAFDLQALPQKMVQSLREIVSDQRQTNLNDPEGTIVWGQVLVDGKPLAGVTVEIETAQEATPVYFNEFFLPDSNLKTTSSNGYFAFIQAPEGFHSLLAKRGEQYFGHENVVVERGVATLSEIKATIMTKPTSFRVFDAFTGRAVDTNLEIQSLKEVVQTSSGFFQAQLPDFHRASLIQTPKIENYLEATYAFDDKSDQVYIPLVNEQWFQSIRTRLRLNELAQAGIVIGFVNDEDYEVYTASEDSKIVRVFFNSRGEIVESQSGTAGGGFILFNVPPASNEILVYGLKSQKFYSQVIGLNPSQTFVLSYKSEL